ncbi:MAG: HEAT repeat domain-containing protein [Planctomycetes bacterium]|nr:HEAT repeat domain-containing protein [Planctomycetota bacterium]
MHPRSHIRPCHLLAILATTATATAQIRWTPSFDDALATAKAERKVVLLAFNMAGERANEELLADHYKDPTLGKLSAATINVFCSQANTAGVPGVSVAQQQAAEQKARLSVLKIGPGEDVIAPQHVWLDPDGAILNAVAYRVTKGELEWAWLDAIRKVDPKFAWQPSPGARAPARLGFGEVERGRNDKPPTKAQVDEALKELKKSRRGILGNLEEFQIVMRSDEPEAVAFVTTTLNGLPERTVVPALSGIGLASPKAYHSVLVPYLGNRDEEVRFAAAQALERMAEPKALPALLKHYREEKVDRVRCHLLRAMAASGPTHKDVQATLDKVLAKEPSAEVRAHAVLALALMEDRTKVHEGLAAALRDTSPKVRATAGYALASRREADFALRLDEAAHREEEPETKAWLEAAAKVVRGGPIDPFKNFLEKVLDEKPPRAGMGLDGAGGGMGGGRNGRRGG